MVANPMSSLCWEKDINSFLANYLHRRSYGNSAKIDIKSNEDLNKSLIATLWAAMIIMRIFCERTHSIVLCQSNTNKWNCRISPQKTGVTIPEYKEIKENAAQNWNNHIWIGVSTVNYIVLAHFMWIRCDAMRCDMMWCAAVCGRACARE